MEKDYILDEIRRTAKANNGVPHGQGTFKKVTGIRRPEWYGKFWRNWGDAIEEAGFPRNSFQDTYKDSELLDVLTALIKELGRFPTEADLMLARRRIRDFPDRQTFRSRFGNKARVAQRLIEFCAGKGDCESVILICREVESGKRPAPREEPERNVFGVVYVAKSGNYYKIGRSDTPGRREAELNLQLPERCRIVHEIRTDDSTGIEAYWHKRFEPRRKNGEWFELTAEDLRAFRRRTFM